MLNIAIQNTGDVAILRCSGRMVLGEAMQTLRGAVVSRANARMIVLDLAQVEFLDASGLAVLLSLNAWAGRQGIQLKLTSPSSFVQRILALTHLDHVFDVSSLEQVLQLLRYPATSDRACCGHAAMLAY
jgi:anti-sigma B factor antagonist